MSPEPPFVSEQTAALYRAPSAKQNIETFLGAVADSRARTMLAALFAALVMFGLTSGLTRIMMAADPEGFLGHRLDAGVAAVLAGTLVWILLDVARSRRLRLMAYAQQVAELNHHVRNALQVIRFQAAVSKDGEEAVAIINDSIARIDEALRNMYPLIHPGRRETPREPRML